MFCRVVKTFARKYYMRIKCQSSESLIKSALSVKGTDVFLWHFNKFNEDTLVPARRMTKNKIKRNEE